MPSHTAYELVLAAFAVNLPFGAYRSPVRRLSWRWFLAIHLPIPAIFLLRISAGYSYWFIPYLFVGAVAGQLIGGRLFALLRTRRQRSTTPTPFAPPPVAVAEGAETLPGPQAQAFARPQGEAPQSTG